MTGVDAGACRAVVEWHTVGLFVATAHNLDMQAGP